MDSDIAACLLCYEAFDWATHLPKILPSCGHTICSECLDKLLQNRDISQRRCPTDKIPFPLELANTRGFPTNYLVKDFLKPRSSKELCIQHNSEKNVVCLTDGEKVCMECVWRGEHQGHNAKTIRDIISETNNQANMVRDTLNNLNICNSKASQTGEKMKELLLSRVKNEFQAIKKAVIEKEQDIVYQIHSYFYHQEQNMDNLIGNSSDARKILCNNANDLESVLTNEEFSTSRELFQKTKDHLANYNTEVDFPVINSETEVAKSKIEGVMQLLKDFKDSQTQIVSQFKINLEKNILNNLALGALKELPAHSSNNPDQIENEEYPVVFELFTSLTFKYHERSLKISTEEFPTKNTIDIEKWKDANNLTLVLSHEIAEEDLEVLAFILREIKGNGLIYLTFYDNGLSHKVLELLAQAPLPYSRVHIGLEKFDLTASHVSILFGKILSQFNNLEEIHIYLNGAMLSKKGFREFLADTLAKGRNIKSLVLGLNKTNINDDYICQLSLDLPSITHFDLGLAHSKVTSRTIEWLRNNLFKPTSRLESLRLFLNNTQITDSHMENLFAEFGKIKDLNLNFERTQITNKTLEALSQAMSTSFGESLEVLNIWLSYNDLTDEGVPLIFRSFPNVVQLGLGLSDTKVTDKTIELLAQKTLLSTSKLNHFTLLLNNLAVTDNSMHILFEALPQLNWLDIRLNSKFVSENSLVPFLVDKVSTMKLNQFQMDISGANVSNEVQAEIKRLEKDINPVK